MEGGQSMASKILVVDDQEGIRTLLYEVLSNAGYQVHTATTGREALDAFNQREFQLLIIDYKLPGLDGLGVLDMLEQQGRKVPVIMISGLTEEITTEKRTYSYIQHILSKPFDVHHMLSLAQAILSK